MTRHVISRGQHGRDDMKIGPFFQQGRMGRWWGIIKVDPGARVVSGHFAGAYLRFTTTVGEQALVGSKVEGATTLEYSWDDHALAVFATKLGKKGRMSYF